MREVKPKETETVVDIGIDGECLICNKLRDPVTGNPPFNAVTLAAFEETKAIMRRDITARRYKPHELDEAFEDLLSD